MAEAPAAVQFAEPVAAADEPLTRMLSSQRPPPSPFEDVPLAGPSAEGAQASAAEAAGDEEEVLPKTRSPRGLAPTKSALKISKDKEAGNGSADAQPGRGLTWADTHGREIQHVQEYQPSEHGSDGFTQRALGCNCCIQ